MSQLASLCRNIRRFLYIFCLNPCFSVCCTFRNFIKLFEITNQKTVLLNSFLCQIICGSENLINSSFSLCKLTSTSSLNIFILFLLLLTFITKSKAGNGGYNLIISIHYITVYISIQENIFISYLFNLKHKFSKKEGRFFHFLFYLLVFATECFHNIFQI